MLGAFKEHVAISFFKGALLKDPEDILSSPGPNSQATRQFRFQDVSTIKSLEPHIINYIAEAISLEKEGKKINFKKTARTYA